MRIRFKAFPFALAYAAQTFDRRFRIFKHTCTSLVPVPLPRWSEDLVPQQTHLAAAASPTSQPASIYAVDDVPGLTDLYKSLLEATGYVVRTFNHRMKALAALKADRPGPALLITNYLGRSMPVSDFIQGCRAVDPSLRILMASGFDQSEMRFSQVKPDRFIQKPFTPEEFHQAVKDVLAAA
jgi:response regulator RpfG family c-di-GMP phosphodiesterase